MSKKCKICEIYEPTASYMVMCSSCLISADKAMKNDNSLFTISKWAINRYKWSLKQKLNIRKG